MTSDVYDSDDALNRSPRLQPQIIKYASDEQVAPFLPKQSASAEGGGDSPSSEGSSASRSRKQRRLPPKPQPTLADAVLISTLEPNRPDIARIAGEQPLNVDSSDEEDRKPIPAKQYKRKHNASQSSEAANLGQAAARALSLLPDGSQYNDETLPAGGKVVILDHPSLPSVSEMIRPSQPSLQHQRSSLRPSTERLSDETLATSPLGKFTIPPSQRHGGEHLPAIQSLQSPPQSATGGSPENTQSLPSIQAALGEQLSEARRNSIHRINGAQLLPFTSISTASPRTILGQRERQPSGPCLPPQTQMPSPYSSISHVSPMSVKDIGMSPAASTPSYWGGGQRMKPDLANMTSPYDTSSHASQSNKSPTAYPTPIDSRPGEERLGASPPSGHLYKCQHPGCNAAPFQTQYLLNSHANVHSQDRPHFCPVPGCPRGFGGKGFKRKNEMIRHGLVHDSPGYVCPFCSDQQHKYPRPDNLQRHVRVHHVDKGKDDPELRKVLSQRPEGSTRGRRRRAHS